MKVNENYRLAYEPDDIFIEQKDEGGAWKTLCPIAATAAMAWEGLERGMAKADLVAAIVGEFDGADEATVAADLEALTAQLIKMGIFLPETT